MKKFLIFSLVLFATLLILEPVTIATTFEPAVIPRPDNLPGPNLNDETVSGTRRIFTEYVLPNFAVGLIGLTAAVSLLFLIIGAVRFITLYGNEEGIDTAKNQIIYALVGLLAALLAYTIVTITINLRYEPITQESNSIGNQAP